MKKDGFTLMEIIIAISLLGIISLMVSTLVLTPMRAQDLAMDEFEVQSELRVLSHNINTVIRDASATFALRRTNHNNLTEGWNYITPSIDHTSIIEYLWDDVSETHLSRVMVGPIEDVTFDLVIMKLTPAYDDNLLQYAIEATVNGNEREVVSEVNALNSLQVIDRGSATLPSNTIAYRMDPRPTVVSSVKAAVAFVLDKSGSMQYTLDNHTANDYSSNPDNHSKMKKLRDEAKRLIEGLASNPNIYASIIPFDSTANGTYAMEPVRVNDTASSVMIDAVNSLSPGGGTNTGDGIRRGYHAIKDFDDSTAMTDYTVKNFLVILVDGVTTFYSAHQVDSPGTHPSDYTYVFGSNNIENIEFDLSGWWNDYDHYFSSGRYGGYGSSLDPWGTDYVDEIGDYVDDYGDISYPEKEEIKVYVIGFSAIEADYGSLQDIATATGADTFYEAGDSAALEAIFSAIQKDINDSLWHVGGPN